MDNLRNHPYCFAPHIAGCCRICPYAYHRGFAGALVDRHDRRKLMIISDLVRACAMAILAAIVIIMGFNSIAIFGAVVIISIFGAVFDPASSALLLSLVKKENLTDGNGFLQGERR